MSGQRESMGPRDYISNLPDEILGKILSLLWTSRAASTSVLSKRWRNLLALVDNLELREDAGDHVDYFGDFVEKTLALLRNSPPIKRCSLILTGGIDDSARVCNWIRTALELGCLELYLGNIDLDTIQPHFMFNSNTLVELTIYIWRSPESHLTPGSMIFPKLKKLSLISVQFIDYETCHGFISGFPLLEDLNLYYSQDDITPTWSGTVSHPSIKRLTIYNHFPRYREAHQGVRFNAPCLEYLHYISYVEDRYMVDLPSLVEARLDVQSWTPPNSFDSDSDDDFIDDVYGENISGNATGLVVGIRNVKTLRLSPDSLEMFYFSRKSMPVFSKLVTLSFESHEERGWQGVPVLINNSPNLETLIIKGLVHQVTDRCGDACVCKKKKHKVCCLSKCRAKVLKILGYGGTCRERKQMKHFLAKLKCLESVQVKVKLSGRENDSDAYVNITNALLNLPRASYPPCQIHFF